MIHDALELRNTLNEIFIDEVDGDRVPEGAVRICGPPDVLAKSSVDWNDTSLVLRVERKTKVGLENFIEKVRCGMDSSGHAHCSRSSPFSKTLAATVVALTLQGNRRFDLLTAMKNCIRPWRIFMWALLPGKESALQTYSFGDFSYGRLDTEKLKTVCEQAKTDAFKRVRTARGVLFPETAALSKETGEVNLISFGNVPSELISERASTSVSHRVVEEYYQTLLEAEKEGFLAQLDCQQAALVVAGNASIPATTFRSNTAAIDWVACFSDPDSQRGWGLYQKVCPGFTRPSAGKLDECKNSIESNLLIQDWMSRTSIDSKLQVFSEYFLAALGMVNHGRIDEATLHLVFGLDLLLGGKAGDALTKVLASRVAMLSHFALDASFEEQQRFIEESYNLRSGYVHRGQKFELAKHLSKSGETMADRFDRLMQTSRILFAAGCFARQQQWCVGTDAHDKWLSRIDLLCQTHVAGKALRTDDLNELGVKQIWSKKERTKAPFVGIDWGNPK